MSIHPLSTSTQGATSNAEKIIAGKPGFKEDAAKIVPEESAAVFEKSDQTVQNTNVTYTRESASLSEITKQVEAKFAGLQDIVESLFTIQSAKHGQSENLSYDQIMEKYQGNLKSFYQNLQVDDATRLKAQQDISEDGFWGVKQTSDRAIEFAIGLAGNDPSKLAEIKAAIEKGYEAAEKAWGGTLPEICQQTKEATLKGLDDWASGTSTTN